MDKNPFNGLEAIKWIRTCLMNKNQFNRLEAIKWIKTRLMD
jgi:hypothetical protein